MRITTVITKQNKNRKKTNKQQNKTGFVKDLPITKEIEGREAGGSSHTLRNHDSIVLA